ncbi:MAG TPA: hypothetical protein VNO54_23625 [Streptosporangiaceae bacterium]|nr:hypothetical protein [Streptosporangiaceae bacterium]
MSPDVTFDVILACGVAGVAALAAGAIAQVATVVTQRRQATDELAALPAPDPTVWRACHAPACGHMETPHDPSPVGFACRDCTERMEGS